jgi:hypothetical protein
MGVAVSEIGVSVGIIVGVQVGGNTTPFSSPSIAGLTGSTCSVAVTPEQAVRLIKRANKSVRLMLLMDSLHLFKILILSEPAPLLS